MKTFKKIKLLTALGLVATYLSQMASQVMAQITNPAIGSLGDDAVAASSGATFTYYFVVIWRSLVSVGAIAVIVFYLWGAMEWITAGGDSGKLEKARNKLLHATIGIIILVSSFTIIAFISNLFFEGEFNILKLTFPQAV